MPYYVYILTNKRNGTLYVGVINDIARRTWKHREGLNDSFTRRYDTKRLVYVEAHSEIEQANYAKRNSNAGAGRGSSI